MDMRKINRMVEAVKSHLTDDLRKPQFRGHENCLAGHCYVASEALYHLLGGHKAGWVPQTIQHEGGSHWYLKHKHSGAIIDPTKEQFATPVPYTKGRVTGFLTKQPSKRTQTVLDRVAANTSMSKAQEDLDKSIGYVSYPKLNVPGPHTSVMESNGIPAREHHAMKNANTNSKIDSSRVSGAVFSNARNTEPTPPENRRMRGFVNLDTKTLLHAKRGHEEQHTVFSRIKQQHGKEFTGRLIHHTLGILSPQERLLVEKINPSSNVYKPDSRPEEMITHFHNYLQDPAHRQIVHQRLGLNGIEARQFEGIIKRAWKKIRIHAATIDHLSLGKAETEARVACSIAVFNNEGHLLMGQRNDNKRWTLPGGKANPGELPEDCARRELQEETGIKAKKLKFLGKGSGGRNGDWLIYSFQAESDEKPTGDNDPDQECDEWEWVDVRLGLPDDLKDQLNNGKNDVTLQLLGLQAGSANDGAELSKGFKHALIGAITAASMASTPAHAEGAESESHTHKVWNPAGLHEDLLPIAHLESSSGKNTKHKPSAKGDFDTAVGAVGLKPSTAHEEYKHSKWLQKTFPDLHDPKKFLDELKSNDALYNHVATSHWQRMKQMFGGDRAKAAYAWRWGQGAAVRDTPEVQAADPYVLAYQKLYNKRQQDQIGKHLINPLSKAEVNEWLAKDQTKSFSGSQEFDHYSNQHGMTHLDPAFMGSGQAGEEKKRPGRIPRSYVYTADTAPEPRIAAMSRVKYRVALPANVKIYDIGDDEHGLMTPKVRHTKDGTFYEASDLDDVERKIKSLGYAGYKNYHPQNPNAVALFVKAPVRSASAI